MKSKFLFQLIVYLLPGIMAMAGPEMPIRMHTGDYVANDLEASVNYHHVDKDDQVVFTANHFNKRHTLLKIRFRHESSFRKDHPDTGKLLNTSFRSTIKAPPTRKSPHIIPFYYVFLFRLTPF